MPDYANGKICYIELPSTNIERDANFYSQIFGWHTRKRGDGATAFDDTVGQVSGTWRTDRKAVSDSGMMVYIMVMDIDQTVAAIEKNGGTITQPVGADHPEITARFRDPSGNIFGLYQQPGV
jgi:uncharacterized protein